jgi:hypothetical protein
MQNTANQPFSGIFSGLRAISLCHVAPARCRMPAVVMSGGSSQARQNQNQTKPNKIASAAKQGWL